MLPPLIEKKLEQLSARRRELEDLLSKPETLERPAVYRCHSLELGKVMKVVARYDEYLRAARELAGNEELSRSSVEDPALRQLAKEEVALLEPTVRRLSEELIDRVLVEDKDASKNVIVEIRAGVGGEEAALFAGDLFRMYSKYAERRGWKMEVMDSSPTDLGGFKEVVFSVSGEDVYRDLRYETGGHRVQRVPQTEASGRIHTSAATVAVLGEPEEVEVEIKDADIEMEFYRSGGPGGQNVNKVSSAVRIRHIPSGIVVAIQEESSQHKNRARALRVLRSRLYEHHESQRKEKEQSLRRNQIGSGDRSQRIRTYNFPQNRVTDHRLNENFNLERIVREGDLTALTEALRAHDREQRMKELL
ncbi:MAG: peptide chain release factor 1 [Planctomycetes bacterium]|nr:peptide chain release factor 1 [Planctomycetota bacterium]